MCRAEGRLATLPGPRVETPGASYTHTQIYVYTYLLTTSHHPPSPPVQHGDNIRIGDNGDAAAKFVTGHCSYTSAGGT